VNHRQRLFVAEYLVDADRSAAAIRAGYSTVRATRQGHELMQNPEIGYAIVMAQRARSRRTGITRERVLVELARLAFADLARIAGWNDSGFVVKPLEEMSDDDAAAIAELGADREGSRVQVRLHDKGFALELLARHCGLYDDAPGETASSARARLMAVLEPYLAAADRAEG